VPSSLLDLCHLSSSLFWDEKQRQSCRRALGQSCCALGLEVAPEVAQGGHFDRLINATLRQGGGGGLTGARHHGGGGSFKRLVILEPGENHGHTEKGDVVVAVSCAGAERRGREGDGVSSGGIARQRCSGGGGGALHVAHVTGIVS
jgi:hypothetical protein